MISFTIGLLEIQVPSLYSIYKESVILNIESLLLLATPVNDRKYDKDRDERLERARKQETLERLDEILQQGE